MLVRYTSGLKRNRRLVVGPFQTGILWIRWTRMANELRPRASIPAEKLRVEGPVVKGSLKIWYFGAVGTSHWHYLVVILTLFPSYLFGYHSCVTALRIGV